LCPPPDDTEPPDPEPDRAVALDPESLPLPAFPWREVGAETALGFSVGDGERTGLFCPLPGLLPLVLFSLILSNNFDGRGPEVTTGIGVASPSAFLSCSCFFSSPAFSCAANFCAHPNPLWEVRRLENGGLEPIIAALMPESPPATSPANAPLGPFMKLPKIGRGVVIAPSAASRLELALGEPGTSCPGRGDIGRGLRVALGLEGLTDGGGIAIEVGRGVARPTGSTSSNTSSFSSTTTLDFSSEAPFAPACNQAISSRMPPMVGVTKGLVIGVTSLPLELEFELDQLDVELVLLVLLGGPSALASPLGTDKELPFAADLG
jgi:hypothetical protein